MKTEIDEAQFYKAEALAELAYVDTKDIVNLAISIYFDLMVSVRAKERKEILLTIRNAANDDLKP